MDYRILVNKENLLDWNYVPDNLIEVSEPMGEKLDVNYINKVDELVYSYFKKMQSAALQAGYEIFIDSSYRSYEYQQQIFMDIVSKKGYDYAIKYCALPGSSEHQTGLAIDIIFRRNNQMIEEQTKDDPEIIWLMQNAYKYGFILRYPKDKQNITGYNFEPWHFRFCGLDLAYELYQKNETLEEYYHLQRIRK